MLIFTIINIDIINKEVIMSVYAVPIKVGIVVFPLIAFLITIPYMIKEYHKFGAIPYLKSFIVYSFALYLLIAWFMVILPLPKIEEVSKMTGPWAQLVPFNGLREIIDSTNFNLFNISTYLSTLKNPAVYTVLFNFVLTLPFGVYLRYYFKRKWWEVIVLSFLLSFFFEVTQFSCLFGIYPRPYRLFDVDDLIVNTTGGFLGYLVTPLFSRFLPSRDELDERAYLKGEKVSLPRKCIASLIDFVIVSVVVFSTILSDYFDIFILFYIFLIYLIISTTLFKGSTIGKKIVGIRIVNDNDDKANISQILIRYILKFFLFFEIFYVTLVLDNVNKIGSFGILLSIILYLMLLIIYFRTFISLLTKKNRTVYESLSKTKHISTIKHERKEIKENNKINKKDK
jgi:glycopeptide antibiotics resistance protein